MDEIHETTDGHPLQGPHHELLSERSPDPSSLCLVLEPIGLRIEVNRPEVIIGRHSQAEVRLALPDISRRHCRVYLENQQWRVADLNSMNGVFVNGERMQEANLYDGDQLQLGSVVFHVECKVQMAANEHRLAS